MPEGALIPIDLYERLIPAIEEIRLQDLVRRRIATQESRPLTELVDELGIDIDLGEE